MKLLAFLSLPRDSAAVVLNEDEPYELPAIVPRKHTEEVRRREEGEAGRGADGGGG